jgi:hypothetical protein
MSSFVLNGLGFELIEWINTKPVSQSKAIGRLVIFMKVLLYYFKQQIKVMCLHSVAHQYERLWRFLSTYPYGDEFINNIMGSKNITNSSVLLIQVCNFLYRFLNSDLLP